MQLNLPTDLTLNGKGLNIAIILPYFNDELGKKLLKETQEELTQQGASFSTTRVFGSMEIAYACKKIIETKKPDAVIALGIIIRGETKHFDLVNEITHQGIMKVQLELNTPIVFGILPCENENQAVQRLHKGKDFAKTAIIQANL